MHMIPWTGRPWWLMKRNKVGDLTFPKRYHYIEKRRMTPVVSLPAQGTGFGRSFLLRVQESSVYVLCDGLPGQRETTTHHPIPIVFYEWRSYKGRFLLVSNHARNENQRQAVHSVCRSAPIILGCRLSISKTAEWPSSESPTRNKFSKSCA